MTDSINMSAPIADADQFAVDSERSAASLSSSGVDAASVARRAAQAAFDKKAKMSAFLTLLSFPMSVITLLSLRAPTPVNAMR